MSAQAGAEGADRHGFGRIVALNEAAKQLLSLSYRVNLLAIDAMLQSKRGGGNLRGFDEVSSQMRAWTRELHAQLEQLNTQCNEVIARTSLLTKQQHSLRLLAEADRQSGETGLQRVHAQQRAATEELGAELDRDWRRVRGRLADLDQLGTMAVVLSRSAMIEASTGTDEQRDLLTQVSQEFFQNSQVAVQTIKSILKQVREA
jgi:hypothetical protein